MKLKGRRRRGDELKTIYKLILTGNSTMMLLIVYAIKEKVFLFKNISLSLPFGVVVEKSLDQHLIFCIYIIFAVLFSKMCLVFAKFLSDEIIEGGIINVEPANNSYLPTYLGYFFVALSVNDVTTLLWVYLLVCIFTYNSQTLYFNPMFLLFNYKFYYVSIETGMKLFIITKKNIKDTKTLNFECLKRINDYTFIER